MLDHLYPRMRSPGANTVLGSAFSRAPDGGSAEAKVRVLQGIVERNRYEYWLYNRTIGQSKKLQAMEEAIVHRQASLRMLGVST